MNEWKFGTDGAQAEAESSMIGLRGIGFDLPE